MERLTDKFTNDRIKVTNKSKEAHAKAREFKVSNQIEQTAMACKLLNPLLEGPLPEEMNEKLAVFRKPTISQCVVCDSV